jgi:hypothetical protein
MRAAESSVANHWSGQESENHVRNTINSWAHSSNSFRDNDHEGIDYYRLKMSGRVRPIEKFAQAAGRCSAEVGLGLSFDLYDLA